MLVNLLVSNFALIKNLEINFDKGINVLSGETGSGKTLLMKALKFVLGDRADKSFIRNGEKFLKVQCVFDSVDDKVKNALFDIGIDIGDDSLIISRTLNIDGKSDIRINGNITTLTNLVKITSSFVDFFGQQEHFSLIDSNNQLKVVDRFNFEKISNIKQELKNLLDERANIISQLSSNYSDETLKSNKIELLSYQIDELTTNNFDDKYEDDLKTRKKEYLNFEKLKQSLENIIQILSHGYSNSSISVALKTISSELKHISSYDTVYDALYEKSNDLRYQVEDFDYEINNLFNSKFADIPNIDELESELDRIKLIKSKYGQTFDERNLFLDNAKKELDFIINNDKIVEELNKNLTKLNEKILTTSDLLYELREQSIHNIESEINKNFADLQMKDAIFKVNHTFNRCIDDVTINGYDKIEFMFTSNLGQPLKQLSKIISGGELSRFMLAYKNVIMQKDGITLLILDEIDSGISGFAAEKVAFKLREISNNCQIISISHLPQIVSIADKNVKIYKQSVDNETYTYVNELFGDELLVEVARLSGSNGSNDIDIKYASELVNKFKKQ